MGLVAFSCTRVHELRLGGRREGDLLHLFLLLPPITGAFILFLRRKDDVLSE